MQPSELDGFAGVTLEGLSPLPIDQLSWGYLANEKSRHLLIFGAFQDRLVADNLAPDTSFYHVLPSFYAAAPMDGAAHWVFLWEAGQVAAIHYNAGEIIPARVEMEKLKEDTVAEAFAGRENLLKRLGTHARNEATAGLLAQPDATRLTRDRLKFSFAHYTSPDAEPTRMTSAMPDNAEMRWTADLRGSLFRASEQKNRRTLMQTTKVLQVAGVFAVLLLIAQIAVFGGRIWVGKMDTQIKAQMAPVAKVDQQVALLSKISLFTDHQLHPFEMLGLIEQFRPKQVYYSKSKFYDNNKLSVSDARSTDSAALQKFLDALQNSGLVVVDTANLHETVAGLNSMRFQLNLTYNSVPEAQTVLPAPKPLGPTPEEIAAQQAQQEAEAAAAADAQANNGPAGPDQGPGGQGGGQGQPADQTAPVYVQQGGGSPQVITNGPAPAAPVPVPAPAPVDAAPAPAPDPNAQ